MNIANNLFSEKLKVNIQKIDNFLVSDRNLLAIGEWLKNLKNDLKQLDVNLIERQRELAYLFTVDDQIVNLESEAELVAYLLLYSAPDQNLALWEEIKPILEKDLDRESVLVVMRYLGQSFYSRDVEAGQYLLANYDILRRRFAVLGENIVKYFEIVFVYIVGSIFDSLSSKDQIKFLTEHTWKILNYNFPIKHYLEDILAQAASANSYLVSSGQMAQSILKGQEKIFLDDSNIITVEKLLVDYSKSDPINDYKAEIWQAYIKNLIAKKPGKEFLIFKLENLVSLYIHLRECDLIDFRGILSDGGAVKPPFGWVQLLQKDLTDQEKEKIHHYVGLLRRPWRTKMELIVAFESVNWRQEPFLSRVLALSDIFDQVYGHFYKPLVYFDEKIMNWSIDKELPDFFKTK